MLALKDSYEAWIQGAQDPEPARARRSALSAYAKEREPLERFAAEMSAPASGSDVPLVAVMRRSVELGTAPALDEGVLDRVPDHRVFAENAATVRRIADDLRRIGAEPILARHPARLLRATDLEAAPSFGDLRAELGEVRGLIGSIAANPDDASTALAIVTERATLARTVLPLARARLLAVLSSGGELHRKLKGLVLELKRRLEELASRETAAAGWRSPLPPEDAEAALVLARRFDGSVLRFLFPAFWRLRRLLRERFDFAARLVRPSYLQILERLVARCLAERQVDEQRRLLAQETGVEDAAPCSRLPTACSRNRSPFTSVRCVTPWQQVESPHLASRSSRGSRMRAIAWTRRSSAGGSSTPPRCRRRSIGLDATLASRPHDVLPILKLADSLPPSLAVAVRMLDLDPHGLEQTICDKSIRASTGGRPGGLDGAALESTQAALVERRAALRRANSTHVVETHACASSTTCGSRPRRRRASRSRRRPSRRRTPLVAGSSSTSSAR